ncbi:hypothetical protein ES702_03566 [subsurface metagenome]
MPRSILELANISPKDISRIISKLYNKEGIVMRHNSSLSAFFVIFMIYLTIPSSILYVSVKANSGTNVGGIIWSDTAWTLEGSPYTITDTVQIPTGVTLTIEPGVTINKPTSGDMFLLHGTIVAHGTSDNKITFGGGGNSNFFSAKNSDGNTFLDLDYCIIKNGRSFWPATGYAQYGHFTLTHSELYNISDYSYVWYPKKNVYIEYNIFQNSGGISTGHSDADVFIRNNLIMSGPFYIHTWANYGGSKTIVKYNSFIDIDGILYNGIEGIVLIFTDAMSATENYWGTTDTDVIDSMIYDRNDDITCWGYIDYLPFLSEPHPDTPKISTSLSCSVSQSTIEIGDSINIAGSISPPVSGATVTISVKHNEGSWNELTTVTTSSAYSYSWTPGALGSYEIKSSWDGHRVYEGSSSNTVPVQVDKLSTSISCSVSSSDLTIGDSVNVSGSINPPISDVTVTLTYTKPDNSIFTRTCITNPGDYIDIYIPDMLGSWRVSASWIGDDTHDGTISSSMSFTVSKLSSSISCSISSSELTIGDSAIISGSILTVSGSIPPPQTGLPVTLSYKSDGLWSTLTIVMSASDGSYSHIWTPTSVASYNLRASWEGDSSFAGSTSNEVSATVTKILTPISCSTSSSEINLEDSITVSGAISSAFSGKTVTLTFTKPDGSTFTRTVSTDSDGSYSDTYTPDADGAWSVTASWNGDSTHESASSSSKSFTVKKSGCLIATATYGSELSPQVQFLRGFRDNTVYSTFAGSSFMKVFSGFYYSFSPSVASVIADNSVLRDIMKVVLYPLIGILHVSSVTFAVFSFIPEFGVIAAGLIASSLIGIFYFLPLALILSYFKKFKVSEKIIRVLGIFWIGTIIAIVIAELSNSPPMMMVSTAIFVLVTIGIATLTSLRIVLKRLIH